METLTALFLVASVHFGLPPKLLSSVCYVESKHNVNAYHDHDGNSASVGICQIKLSTAQWLGFKGTEKELMLPNNNIHYAAKYLWKLRKRYHGDLKKTIIAYNIGHAEGYEETTYSIKVYKQWSLANESTETSKSLQTRYLP